MSLDLPIVCTLDAGALTERLAAIADIGRRGLLDTHHRGGRAVLRFAPRAGIGERLAAIVAAERECCAFLELTLQEAEAAIVLTIAAPAGAELVVEELVAAFSAARRPA